MISVKETTPDCFRDFLLGFTKKTFSIVSERIKGLRFKGFYFLKKVFFYFVNWKADVFKMIIVLCI